ncbi:MAG: hypothetical protein ACI8P0_003669 [Planctomycetaceae bacterium]
MATKLIWDEPSTDFIRGGAVEAAVNTESIADVAGELLPVWNWIWRLFDNRKCTSVDALSKVVVEIWPDSGRWIFVVSSGRELARVDLEVGGLEQLYFALPRVPDEQDQFERAYLALLSVCVESLKESLVGAKCDEITIIARDSDDEDTDVILAAV